PHHGSCVRAADRTLLPPGLRPDTRRRRQNFAARVQGQPARILPGSSPAPDTFPADSGSGRYNGRTVAHRHTQSARARAERRSRGRAERRRQAMTTGANAGVGADAEVPAPPTDPASFELRILDPKRMRVFRVAGVTRLTLENDRSWAKVAV